MKDVSNKTLAILAVIAIAVGIIGILISGPKITGQAGTTQTGTTDLNITGVVSITLTTDTVDFGSGYVNASADNCTMNSEGTNPNDCVGFSTVSSGFILENDGNVVTWIQLNAGQTPAQLIGGTNPSFGFKMKSIELKACDDSDMTSYEEIGDRGHEVCTSFSYQDTKDEIEIHIQVTIPDDANVGFRNTNVTFTATEV